ncbi:MAG: DUF4249 domain-containing protein [Cyclobacteriaceae bacterium]|nr:DUF4249 domain-containing protein [Cyclobacteriaceae bacterium]MDH4295559.1 DUF4249 domain-containing protein [Cyclobacteriaceae bacterium]MDH5249126.1 DUF4249 domain-containing protein [Cyclobacteriaceae bacterium]
MFKKLNFFFFLLFIVSCIEPYEFVIRDETQGLVVDAYISDKSFTETLSYPSDGRYFTVRLSTTSDVINIRPVMVTGAVVTLLNDLGEEWGYTESAVEPGVYYLLDNDFKALQEIQYKLRISPPDDNTYESEWQTLPAVETPSIGDIGFVETERQKYIVESNENVLRTIKGIEASIAVAKRNSSGEVFYRWDFTPLWIYVAPLSSTQSPFHQCWASSKNYIPDYVLQIDNVGGYKKDLFFLETIRNEKLFEDFSVLVTQFSTNQDYYFFWKEMQEQAQAGAIFDSPPYNLQTNLHAIGEEKPVSGYFGVVQEQARRWYFNIGDLSYTVENTLRGDCLVDYGPGGPAEECNDCREYSFGMATTTKPLWWRQ